MSTEREQIKQRLAAITPWPWMVVAEGEFIGDHAVRQDDGHGDGWWIAEVCVHINGDDNGKQHAEFIANAPADIDSLLSENDALRARVAELEDAVKWALGEEGEFPSPERTKRGPLPGQPTLRDAIDTARRTTP